VLKLKKENKKNWVDEDTEYKPKVIWSRFLQKTYRGEVQDGRTARPNTFTNWVFFLTRKKESESYKGESREEKKW
jgi:hypothetical protein